MQLLMPYASQQDGHGSVHNEQHQFAWQHDDIMTKVGDVVFWIIVFWETRLCTPNPVQVKLMQLM